MVLVGVALRDGAVLADGNDAVDNALVVALTPIYNDVTDPQVVITDMGIDQANAIKLTKKFQ